MNGATIANFTSEITLKGERVYREEIEKKLKDKDKGKTIVIEVDSSDFFIDEDPVKAIEKAKKKYPSKLFYITRVGDLFHQLNFSKVYNERLF